MANEHKRYGPTASTVRASGRTAQVDVASGPACAGGPPEEQLEDDARLAYLLGHINCVIPGDGDPAYDNIIAAAVPVKERS